MCGIYGQCVRTLLLVLCMRSEEYEDMRGSGVAREILGFKFNVNLFEININVFKIINLFKININFINSHATVYTRDICCQLLNLTVLLPS